MSQSILTETFDDGVLNPDPWTYTYDVTETNGYLFLNQSTTDLRSSATYTFNEPIYDATITFDTFNHDSNNRHMATTLLGLTAEDGTPFTISFAMLKNPYIGGLDGDPSNYDLPRIKIEDSLSPTDWYFSSGANTSSFLDDWTTVTMSLDSETGMLLLDVDSDGLNEFEIQDDRIVGAELDFLYFNSYGWYTGHYVYIDNLTVTGKTSLGPETPISTGFSMPVGERDGLVVTEAQTSEDGWLDGWYNASDLGAPHPTTAGANHLGEDWNLDAGADDEGQAVYAVSVGRVVYTGEFYGASGPSNGFGQTVVIEHLLPDGRTVYSLYAHLQENSIAVETGQIIDQEAVQIGAIGETGATDDPHLHFELFEVSDPTGAYEDAPWLLAMEEFGYTTENIAPDAESHTIDFPNGSVTWFDPSDFIEGGIGFDIDQPMEVSGGNGVDMITGGSGNDNLSGGNGQDTLYGNAGSDVLNGGNGSDQGYGGTGSDYLVGGKGADELFGGIGADQIEGGNGADVIDGGEGNDLLFGGNAVDQLNGGAGDDQVEGGKGADIINGGDGDDSLIGGNGADSITGGDGADQIEGGRGGDIIEGGGGDDILSGDQGADVFVFDLSETPVGADTLLDFAGNDILRIIGGVSAFDQLSFDQQIDGVLVTLGTDASVLLLGTTEADLTENQFLFI